jgi:conjugal transfer pilin signal peptidase TrbI
MNSWISRTLATPPRSTAMTWRPSILRVTPWSRRDRLAALVVGAIWCLACWRLFVDHTPQIPILFNATPSLPYMLAWLHPADRPLQRGDYIVYRFDGEARQHYPGLAGQPFFKQIVGLPGQRIEVSDRQVWIDGQPVGTAKTHAHDRRPLDPIAPGLIPQGHYYVAGSSLDSFDSRYRSSGLVRADQVIGRVTPLF